MSTDPPSTRAGSNMRMHCALHALQHFALHSPHYGQANNETSTAQSAPDITVLPSTYLDANELDANELDACRFMWPANGCLIWLQCHRGPNAKPFI